MMTTNFSMFYDCLLSIQFLHSFCSDKCVDAITWQQFWCNSKTLSIRIHVDHGTNTYSMYPV